MQPKPTPGAGHGPKLLAGLRAGVDHPLMAGLRSSLDIIASLDEGGPEEDSVR